MALRYQNRSDTTDRVPGYYVNNRLYPRSYQRNEYPTRVSRRVHDGLSLDRNFGLDTQSDDLDASPYSSPYYINGRYNSDDLVTQTGNSASVTGTTRLLTVHDDLHDFTEDDIESAMWLWQGKQVKFEVPYTGKVVGITITIRNTEDCHGILSVYLSATDGGPVLAEASVDLCSISQDHFEHKTLYLMTPVSAKANPRGTLHVRMEIWDEIEDERSDNPFNTGKAIEIAATGHYNHYECIYELGEKNIPVEEEYNYTFQPSAPLIGLIYNEWRSIPVNRNEGVDYGAKVSKDGYVYDIFCIKSENQCEVLVYDQQANQLVPNNIKVDGRAEFLNIVQAEDYIYYVDGYSPLQRTRIGEWNTYTFPVSDAEKVAVSLDQDKWFTTELSKESGVYRFTYTENGWEYMDEPVTLSDYGLSIVGTPSLNAYIQVTSYAAAETIPQDATAQYVDVRPVIGASLIIKHFNRIYLAGFRYDRNLVQFSQINSAGPAFNSYPYRFYSPGQSPLSTSDNPITAIVEYESDTIMIATTGGYSLYRTSDDVEATTPQQVSTYSDGAGVQSQGDITNYQGRLYSFDPDEGIRRFNGQLWQKIPAAVDSHIARVDMTKPRKLWCYAQKLYFNYTDRIDKKAKCLIWDMDMNYQQFPWFQDSDLPFCDVRGDDDWNLLGIHPDFPCIMRLYDTEVWRRLDTPITFERHTKQLSLPGNAADMILKRVHNKVIANANRWWWFGLSANTDTLEQIKGDDKWYRMPCWDTIDEDQPVETPFPEQDIYEKKAIAKITLPNLKMRAISVQEKVKAKTFRAQANLVSVLMESGVRSYN